ncbi:phospholipase D-like domain-containing protein [Streptomyces sp. NPDC101132]|uniref:phospholipase D-like domain-containing protein n=1 Tax=Streptomyces sp. NPDC101132 TaxID=3366110 RepID=UPI00380BA450
MRTRVFRRFAVASTLAVSASLLGGHGATAADTASPVTPKAVFNDPATSPNAIRDELIRLIDNTADGGLIRGSIFLFTDNDVREALKRAASREGAKKVTVQIVFDEKAVAETNAAGEPTGTEFGNLGTAFGRTVKYGDTVDAATAGSFVLACEKDRGCIGNRKMTQADGDVENAINHNKFFLFSKVGTTENVVFQSSANLTTNHRTAMYNNAVVVPHKELYDEYDRYWNDQVRLGVGGDGLDHYYKTKDVGDYKTYFFPRREDDDNPADGVPADPRQDPDTDTVVDLLENVTCSAASPSKIRIGMYAFTRTQVADRLRRMAADGCTVQVVLNGDKGSVGTGVRDVFAAAPGVDVRMCQGGEDKSAPGLGIHSKYLLIDGTYLDKPRKLVFTGSHNYTYPNLRSQDETLLKIDNAQIYEGFRKNFDETLLQGSACRQPMAVPF